MAQVLDGANTTAQWYEDTYLGSLFTHLEKFVIHTTETTSWPGYSGGASAPNATYHPRLRQTRQHFSNNRSARALRDPSGTAVRENRDRVFQLEIIAYSDKAAGDSVGGLWIGDLTDGNYADLARMCIQLATDLDLPLKTSVTWKEGAVSYYGGVRLTGPSYDGYSGILGHIHVSGNTHWDPGGFRASKLMAKITELLTAEEDDVTPEECEAIMRQVLADRVITLDWDGGVPKKVSIYEALSYIHFNAADGSYVGTVPDTSMRTSRRGTDTYAKTMSTDVDALVDALPPGEGDPVDPTGPSQ